MADDKAVDEEVDPIQEFMGRILKWMHTADNRPRELTITSALSRLPNGTVARVFQMHTKELVSQITETAQEPSRIISPNGVKVPKLG